MDLDGPALNGYVQCMEIWREIPTWEGYYAASNLGRIKRLAGSPRCRADRILKGMPTERGYLTVSPVRSGQRQRPMMVHRLVLSAFIGEPPTLAHEANHINGDKLDNRLENLEWVTRAGNVQHAYDTGLHGKYKGSAASAAKLDETQVAEILEKVGRREYRADIAAEYGVSEKAISEIVTGAHWTHVDRPDLSGRRVGRDILEPTDIPAIRRRLAAGESCRSIGDCYGVSGPTIWQIKAGRTWKDS